jgi:hypothetical protein
MTRRRKLPPAFKAAQAAPDQEIRSRIVEVASVELSIRDWTRAAVKKKIFQSDLIKTDTLVVLPNSHAK